MLDERSYRFLIAGATFFGFLGLMFWLDPGISLLGLLVSTGIGPMQSFALVVLGGSLLLVLVGYASSEIVFPSHKKQILRDICTHTQASIQRVIYPANRNPSVACPEEIVFFTHAVLAEVSPQLKDYFYRSWSHTLTIRFIRVTILLAFVFWLLFATWAWRAAGQLPVESKPAWYMAYSSLPLPFWQCRLIACGVFWIIGIAVIGLLTWNLSNEFKHRARLYDVTVETRLLEKDWPKPK